MHWKDRITVLKTTAIYLKLWKYFQKALKARWVTIHNGKENNKWIRLRRWMINNHQEGKFRSISVTGFLVLFQNTISFKTYHIFLNTIFHLSILWKCQNFDSSKNLVVDLGFAGDLSISTSKGRLQDRISSFDISK